MNRRSTSERIVPSGGLTFGVTDFGPIAKADVDLRPLTVFIGPSNTGKSYLAILLYVLHRCFRDFLQSRDPFTISFGAPYNWIRAGALPSPVYEQLDTWLRRRPAAAASPALPAEVAEQVRSVLERAEGLHRRLQKELERCFGVERIDPLVRIPSTDGGARVDFEIRRTSGEDGACYRLDFGNGFTRLSGRLPVVSRIDRAAHRRLGHIIREELVIELDDGTYDEVRGDARPQGLDHVFEELAESTLESLVEPMSNAYYLPADRTGVMHSHQVVVSTLVQHATTTGLRSSVEPMSGVLADFLGALIAMGRPVPDDPQDAGLGALLEKHVLRGDVLMNRSGVGYPLFTYRPTGWEHDLPLMRASSMVSELAPVVLYLRNLVRPGELLIIEEPEAHLHPAMQAAFARELGRLVRAGVRIVMTTHSEWFLEQIGNLVRLSSLPEDQRAGIAGADVALGQGEVGVWLFKPDAQGSVVEEVEVDPETGLFPTDFDAVSETLYNDSAAIFNRTPQGDDAR